MTLSRGLVAFGGLVVSLLLAWWVIGSSPRDATELERSRAAWVGDVSWTSEETAPSFGNGGAALQTSAPDGVIEAARARREAAAGQYLAGSSEIVVVTIAVPGQPVVPPPWTAFGLEPDGERARPGAAEYLYVAEVGAYVELQDMGSGWTGDPQPLSVQSQAADGSPTEFYVGEDGELIPVPSAMVADD